MTDPDDMTTFQLAIWSIWQGLQYSFFEVAVLIVLLLASVIGDGVIHSVILWTVFSMAALWTLSASTSVAYDTAKDCVLLYDIFIMDFIVTAFVLSLIGVLLLPYPWQFSTMLFLAAAQNLRYTWLSISWLLEASRDDRTTSSNDDNLP